MSRRALITGVTGQDGSYLAEYLLSLGYKVFGIVRRSATPDLWRLADCIDRITLIEADLNDQGSLIRAVEEAYPTEVYNLAAMSYVPASWQEPVATVEVTGLGCVRMLEALRITKSKARFYQAGSSEQFGNATEEPQSEMTPFRPRSPYGFAKVLAHHATVNYRESYGMFACVGILFNHESPRRGVEFVTRKITRAAARISKGLQDKLELGNLGAMRDWGSAPEYVQAMWLMLQQDAPDDFVIATGKSHEVETFADMAFGTLGMDYKDYVVSSDDNRRPAELYSLRGDPGKANRLLNWYARTQLPGLVGQMVDADLKRIDDAKGAQ